MDISLASSSISVRRMNSEVFFAGSDEQRKLFNYILQWDLSREKCYLNRKLGYTDLVYLDDMEIEYKKFIFLLASYPEKIIPISEKVDDLWHLHVLNTKRYREFCSSVIGRFIDHTPTISDDENLTLMPEYKSTTLTLLQRHFGEPNYDFWLDVGPLGACCTH